METKKALIEALSAMRTELDGFEEGVEASKRTSSGNYEHWGPKDLAAHAAEWTQRLVRDIQGEDADSPDESIGDLNRHLFELHEQTGWSKIMGMLREGVASIHTHVQSLTEEDLQTEGENGRPLWWGMAFYGMVHNLTHLGQALVRSGSPEQALDMQRRMDTLLVQVGDYAPWTAMLAYNLGRILLLTGKKQEAIGQIRRAIEHMPAAAEWIQRDEDFESIRGEF